MNTQIGIVDSHVHVFSGETAPLFPARSYTPDLANEVMLRAHLDRISASRVVIVQPSPYGTNNEPSLNAVARLGLETAKCVIVVDPHARPCGDLTLPGVCGLRANFKTSGDADPEYCLSQLRAMGGALGQSDKILEIFAPVALLYHLRAGLSELGRPVILDHFGGLKLSSPILAEDLEKLHEVLSLGNVILKASGACRATNYAPTHAALDGIAPALFATAKGRVIWGSDWPHTGKSEHRINRPLSELEEFQDVDDVQGVADIRRWAGTANDAEEILWNTPNALFGF